MSGATVERRSGAGKFLAAGGAGGRGAAVCGMGMELACNGIFFSYGQLSGLLVERAAIRGSLREAGR